MANETIQLIKLSVSLHDIFNKSQLGFLSIKALDIEI